MSTGKSGFWVWRPKWHQDVCYSIGYQVNGVCDATLCRSEDGLNFHSISAPRRIGAQYGEDTILFLPDQSALCLFRNFDGNQTTGLGRALPPYEEWDWKSLNQRVAGPNMIQLPDGRIIVATRLYDGAIRTSFAWVDPANHTLSECFTLPSGGDTGYAGLVWKDDLLWISYYSSHEGKASIYLAKVAFDSPDSVQPVQSANTDGWIDLIAAVDPVKDVSTRNNWRADQNLWEKQGSDLVFLESNNSGEILLPNTENITDFEIRMAMTRESGTRGIDFKIPTPGGATPIIIGANTGSQLKGTPRPLNFVSHPLTTGQRMEVVITVRSTGTNAGIKVEADGKPIIDWRGDYRSELGVIDTYQSKRIGLWIGLPPKSDPVSKFRFHEILFRRL